MSIGVRTAIVTVAGMASLTSRTLAHEGHGNPQWHDSILHYLGEPLHLPLPLTLAALVALGVAVRRLYRRSAPRSAGPC